MKALAIRPGIGDIHVVDRPEPSITSSDEIKLKIIRVGICGTDREEVSGGRALAPAGHEDLVIGHEMFGRVVAVGSEVKRVKPGDYAVFTVRRGCGKCLPCSMNRSDMCETGEYTERGIKGRDGYQTEYVVDKEMYVARIPDEIRDIGVLAEPLTISEKAMYEAINLQAIRLPDASVTPDWLYNRCCLVAGLGPVGLLASMALRLRGAEVFGLDIVDPDSARPQWLESIGGHYLDGRRIKPDRIDSQVAPMELIFEAAGIPALAFDLIDALAINGVYVMTGVPGGNKPAQLPAAELMRRLVLRNQVLFGSVNACRSHFQMAIDDLVGARLIWGDKLSQLITNHFGIDRYEEPFQKHGSEEIKAVVEWNSD